MQQKWPCLTMMGCIPWRSAVCCTGSSCVPFDSVHPFATGLQVDTFRLSSFGRETRFLQKLVWLHIWKTLYLECKPCATTDSSGGEPTLSNSQSELFRWSFLIWDKWFPRCRGPQLFRNIENPISELNGIIPVTLHRYIIQSLQSCKRQWSE